MSKGINKALLLGHVGNDPDVRFTPGNLMVASFPLATSDRCKDGQGGWGEQTEWHNLVAFGGRAEVIRDYVKKGTQLFIVGKIRTRSWDDKQTGQKRFRTEVLIDDLTLLGGTNHSNGHDRNGRNGGPTQRDPAKAEEYAYVDPGDY